MRVTLLLVTSLLVACGDSKPRVSSWQARCDELVSGKYQACYGPGWNADGPIDRPFENYQVSVERIFKGGSETTFSRTFPAGDVPPSLLNTDHPTVLAFDRQTGKVTFSIGEQRIHAFVVPGPAP